MTREAFTATVSSSDFILGAMGATEGYQAGNARSHHTVKRHCLPFPVMSKGSGQYHRNH